MEENRKKILRKDILHKRAAFSNKEVATRSRQIYDSLSDISYFKEADTILIYASYNNEVDTFGIIRNILDNGKKVAIPKVLGKGIMEFYYINSIDNLKKSSMGILEPDDAVCKIYTDNSEKKVMICPGVVFDREGNRIGYGGGFYDRYLEKHNMVTIAIAFDIQLIDKIECTEITDRKMDVLITNKEVLRWDI